MPMAHRLLSMTQRALTPRALSWWCGHSNCQCGVVSLYREKYDSEVGVLQKRIRVLEEWVQALRLALNTETEQVGLYDDDFGYTHIGGLYSDDCG